MELRPASPTELGSQTQRGLRQIGITRTLSATGATSPDDVALPGGRHALRIKVHSPGARGIRIHVTNAHLGSGRLWFYAPPRPGQSAPRSLNSYTGADPFQTDGFWSPTVESDTVVIDFETASAEHVFDLPFRVDSIAHQWTTLPRPQDSDPNAAASCELDISCYPDYANYGTGVGFYSFVADSGGTFACSGALINTVSKTYEPYFLTAHHCISSETEAESVEAFFGYQTQTCNGPADFRLNTRTERGATYLVGGDVSVGDYALLRFHRDDISGYYFGWSAEDPAVGDPVVGIHHPEASWTRISFGTRDPDRASNISGVPAPANLFFQIAYTQGIVEPGSSGSPLLNASGQIVGLLSGAPSGSASQLCAANPFYAIYGRLSSAYPALKPYIDPDPAPSFTISPSELNFSFADNANSSQDALVTVTPNSPSLIPFSATPNSDWIGAIGGSSGLASTSSPGFLDFRVSTLYLTQSGTYKSSIAVTVGTGQPVELPVTLNIANTQSQIVPVINFMQATMSQSVPVGVVSDTQNGFVWPFWFTLTETAGVPTQLTAFKIGAQDLTDQIPSIFGSNLIGASESVSTFLTPANVQPGVNSFEIAGVDPATNRSWSQQFPVGFEPTRGAGATELIVNGFPGVVSPDPSNALCRYRQHIVLQALGSDPVLITGFYSYSLAELAALFGSTYIPAGGAVQAEFCWTTPEQGPLNIGGGLLYARTVGSNPPVGDGGNESQWIDVQSYIAAPPASTLIASQSAIALKSPATQSSVITIDPGAASATWTVSTVYKGAPYSWLTVSPRSGTGPGSVQVTANPTGLVPGGLYQSDLIIQAEDCLPQYLTVPVTFQPPAAGLGIVNGASFSAGIAPGGIASIFDPSSNLSSSPGDAAAIPLPTDIAGTSITVNGVSAPLYFVSPGQVNLQIPYEVAPGPASLIVHTKAGVVASQTIYVNAEAPGIFLSDGKHVAPNTPVKAGAYATIYATGQGYVAPSVPTGDAPPGPTQVPASGLPMPFAGVEVYVNGVAAETSFVGIPYFLVGVTQINFLVPAKTPPGDQPIQIVVGHTPSNTGLITVE